MSKINLLAIILETIFICNQIHEIVQMLACTDHFCYTKGIADKMRSARLAQIFCPIEAANRTHSKGYVEDLLTISGRKRCVKMVVPNLSVIP